MNTISSHALEEAERLFDDELYEEALTQYRTLAEKGDSHALTMVGWIHEHGLGVPQDDDEAVKWYKLSAKLRSPSAEFNLGALFMRKKDYESARIWYESSASHGYLPALYRLAWIYEKGQGVSVDKDKAYDLFEQNALNGHVFSQKVIGKKLLSGRKGFIFRIVGLFYFLKSFVQIPIIGIRDLRSDRIRP